MSVYHEALKSGRLTAVDIANHGGSLRSALRAVKRREAEERNFRTPDWRRKAARRAAAAAQHERLTRAARRQR